MSKDNWPLYQQVMFLLYFVVHDTFNYQVVSGAVLQKLSILSSVLLIFEDFWLKLPVIKLQSMPSAKEC